MAELVTKLREQGNDLIDNKGEEFLDRLIGEGREKKAVLSAAVSEVLPGSEELTVAGVEDMLDLVAANKQPILRLSKVGFAWAVGYFESDEEAKAQRLYMAAGATFEERQAFRYASGDRALEERREREESWEAFKSLMLKIGERGLKLLVKLLVMSLAL